MPQTVIKIETWTCKTCTYKQDFEPTQEAMDLHFNRTSKFRLNNVKANECPCCLLKGENSKMAKEVTDKGKITVRIMGEEDIEQEIIDLNKQEKEKTGEDMTTLEKENHREKRKLDIQEAITKARLVEDK
jgi:ribosomal 50S subunit-recycling heat shock protein